MDMHDTLRKIRALHSLNEEIIQRVESQDVKTCFCYVKEWDKNHRLAIAEHREDVSVKQILCSWRMGEHGKDIEKKLMTFAGDLSSDLLYSHDYTWEELKLLNARMIAPAELLARILDGNSTEAIGELRKYQSNFEILHVALGSVEEFTMSETSTLAELSEKAAAANKLVDEISSRPSFVKQFSSILTSDQWVVLRGWYGSGPRLWPLLYKGTRDGMQVSIFHQRCDKQGATVVVVKSSGGFVFGGYAATSWSANQATSYISCNDSSLFTLRNPHGIKPTIFKSNAPGQYALLHHPSYGPTFGGGNDLHTGINTIGAGSYTNFGHTFLDTTGKREALFTGQKIFQIQEIEVYKVV